MSKKMLVIFLCALILNGCSNNSDTTIEPVYANNQFFTLGKKTFEVGMTASESGVYWIDNGSLFYYDIEAKTEVKLTSLNYCDDLPCDDQEAMTRFGDNDGTSIQMVSKYGFTPFIQYFDDYIYIFVEVRKVDGSYSLNLVRLDKRGENQETIIGFEEVPYNLVITNFKLFYLSSQDNRPYFIDFTTKEKKAIDLPSDQGAVAYTIDNNFVYLITSPKYSNPDSQSDPILFTYYRFDTLTDTLAVDLKHQGHLLGVFNNVKLLSVVEVDGDAFMVIDESGSEMHIIDNGASFNLYNKQLYGYESINSTLFSSNIDGSNMKELLPDITITDASLKTMTPIIGIVNDHALVGMETSEGSTFYTIDLVSGKWSKAFNVR